MNFYNLKCEVPGGLGPETVFDKDSIPWKVRHPHIVVDGWLGGELLTVGSCLLISNDAMNGIMFDYSGIKSYQTFQLGFSDNCKTLQPNLTLPNFRWLKVGDNPFVDDVAMTFYNNLYNQLIISDSLWKVLSTFELGNFQIQEAKVDLF